MHLNMKRELLLVAFSMLLCSGAKAALASGEIVEYGYTVYWSVSDDGTELSLTGNGFTPDLNHIEFIDTAPWEAFGPKAPWYDYREGITTVELGPEVALGYGTFVGLDNLQNINVDVEHAAYRSVNGIVYSRNRSVLVQYPTGRAGSFTLPSYVESMEDCAFMGCTKLTEVIFPKGSTVICETMAFAGCTALERVQLANTAGCNLRSFWGCTSLTSVDLCKNTTIYSMAFSLCTNLKEINLEEGHVSAKVIDGVQYSHNFTLNTRLLCCNVPLGRKIKDIVLPSNTYAIASGAMLADTDLESLTLPENFEFIEYGAITGCTSLKKITSRASTPPRFINFTLAPPLYPILGIDTENCVVYVPKGCVEAYKAADTWREFKHIEEDPGSSGVGDVNVECQSQVDVYDVQGKLLRSNVMRDDATQGLPQGVYIVGNKKVIVK